MSRRRSATQRKAMPDPVHNSVLATRFINSMMLGGKKSLAAKLFYEAVEVLGQDAPENNGFAVFEQAIKNVRPMNEVKTRRIGGSNYQVPVKVRFQRQTTLAIRWLIIEARKRKEKSFPLRLAGELRDAANGVGSTMKKRENVHKMAEANRAFSHFRL